MLIWVAIILGLIQGFTEFLPVSSSGHLVIAESLFGINMDYNFLNVLLHISTLLAVIIYYRKKILYLITHPTCRMNRYLLVATIPAVVLVLLTHSIFGTYMENTLFVGIGFLLTALFLSIAQIVAKKTKVPSMLKYSNVMVMGIAQAFAVFPGLSRSGTTLSFGLLSGVEKQNALDFSFLMSIPIIVASVVYEIFWRGAMTEIVITDVLPIIISCITALFTALLGIIFMNKIIRKINLWYFVPYLIVLGLVVIFVL